MAVDPARVKAIFFEAIEKGEPHERDRFIDQSCGDDSVLRARVNELLQAFDRPDQLLDRAAAEHLEGDDLEPADPAAPNDPPRTHDDLRFLAPTTRADSLGRLAHYEVLEVIGRGGMGIVLRAFDEKLHRLVAIKVLSTELESTGSARQRFVREARAAAAVTNEHVIAIHSVEDSGPVCYLVMQYINGKTLQQRIDASGPLALAEILRIGLQIADGLAAAHRQGLIHRDIKPANILLEDSIERVKITDFGLARAAADASLTQSGVIAGTPLYMSPEQAQSQKVDHRTDLFSLGSVLYAMSTGHSPFRASHSIAVLNRVCEDKPRPLPEINAAIPGWFDDIVQRLLAKDRAERFQTAEEVAAVLGRCLAQVQMGSGLAVNEIQRVAARRRRFSVARNLLALLMLLALVLSGVFFASRFGATSRPGQPSASVRETTETEPGTAPPAPVELNPVRTLVRHTSNVLALALSPDGKVLASGSKADVILLWDVDTWTSRVITTPRDDISGLAFSPDGSTLAAVSWGVDVCGIRLWDVRTARPAGLMGAASPKGNGAVGYSPDGTLLAYGGFERALTLFNLVDQKRSRTIPNAVSGTLIRGLSFSPDGRRIAVGGSGPTRVWDVTTGDEVPTEQPLPNDMNPTFVPGRNELAGWHHHEGRVTLCELPSGRVRASWRAHSREIEGLAVSPDGRFLASTGREGLARIWSTADQTEVATLTGHKGSVYSAVFWPDGTRLITAGSEDFTIRLWDLPAVCRVVK